MKIKLYCFQTIKLYNIIASYFYRSLGFSFIYNFTIGLLPLQDVLYYYTCTDIDPWSHQKLEKNTYPRFEAILSVLLHVFVLVRIKVYKAKIGPIVSQEGAMSMNGKSLTNFATNIFIALWICSIALINARINSTPFSEVNRFPTNIYIFAFQYFGPCLSSFFISCAFYGRHSHLRQKLLSEVREILNGNIL